jgi:RND family efflux transporter MFP subunit
MKEVKKAPFYKKRKFWIATISIFAVVIFFYYKILSSRNGKVQTSKIEKGTVSEELVLSGDINADEYANLTFPTSGEISWVGVKEGDEVKAGQSLLKLDTTVLNSAFQQAKATLRAAEATVQNIYDQVQDHSSDETFAQRDVRTAAEAAKDRAYESYIAALYNLNNSTLTAPFAGIISFLAHPYPGVNVIFSETQVEIINPDTIYFDVTADQSDVINLYLSQEVLITLDSLPEEKINGEVAFIGYTPKLGEAGTVYKVKVDIKKDGFENKNVRIGMSGDASFIIKEKSDVLYVPPKFINADTKGKYLKVGNADNRVYIDVGIEGEERVEIISEKVKEGDTIFD